MFDEIHEIFKLLFDLEINNDLYDINKGYILDFLMKINTLMLKERIKMTKNGRNAFDLLIKELRDDVFNSELFKIYLEEYYSSINKSIEKNI